MKKKTIYTYEFCEKIVKKYKTLKELRINNYQVYVAIHRNKWNELIDNLPKEGGDYLRTIYSYEFKKYNSVYVGLTFDIKKRDIDHHRKGTVFNFTKEHNISFFEPKILEKDVEYYSAGAKEAYYINFYKNNGWKLLNKVKAGSLGCPMHEATRKICCFNSEGNLEHICTKKEACEKFNIKYSNLLIALRNFNRVCNGYRFIYKDVWENNNLKLDKKILSNEPEKIAILDKNLNLIHVCKTKIEAKQYCNIKSSCNNIVSLKHFLILNVGKLYKCCYYDDYVKYKNNEYSIAYPQIPKCKKIVFVPNNVSNRENFIKDIVKTPQWEINRLNKRKK
jgi:hypothetical protein